MPHRILTHRPAGLPDARRAYERQRPRQADKDWYKSPAWRAVRAQKLAIDPLCEDCLKADRTTAAEHVHHVIERKVRPDLALDISNLESLCKRCHNAKRGKP
jgi:5-methylcytosine-specific restriction protein A